LPIGLLYCARRIRAVNGVTIQDFFEMRYKSKSVRGLATVVLIISLLGYTIGQLMGAGMLLSTLTGMPYEWLVLIFAIACVVFLSFGGQYGVTITDAGMFVVMLLMVFVVGPMIVGKAGGISAIVSAAYAQPAAWSIKGLPGMNAMPFLLSIVPIWVMYSLASPGYASRGYAARSDLEMMKASFVTILMFLVIPAFIGFLVMPAVKILGPDINPAEVAFTTVMINSVPTFWAGIGLAGIMAALLTTASSFLLYVGMGLSRDFYKSIIKPDASEKSEMMAARLFQVVGVLATILFAMSDPAALFWIVTYANGAFVTGWIPILIGGFEWKGASRQGALASLIVGPTSYVIFHLFKIIPTVDPIFWGLGFSTLAFIAISLMFKPSQAEKAWFEKFKSKPPGDREIKAILSRAGGREQLVNEYSSLRNILY